MELLGNSLENLFQTCKKKFSIKTTCMLGIQILDRIEYVHSRKIIHRDIKPDNFVMGANNNAHIVYILDFGLSKKFWSSTHRCHIPFTKGKKLTGTARYASINALSGGEQSRRDDLESIGYILMYFLRGSLPWQGLKINRNDDRYKKVCEKKRNTSSEELCKGFPEEFEEFVSYTRNLKFTQVPDYDFLRGLLKTVMKKGNMSNDFFYDWTLEKPNIRPDNIIYTNNYSIEYNGKNEWLNGGKNSNKYVSGNGGSIYNQSTCFSSTNESDLKYERNNSMIISSNYGSMMQNNYLKNCNDNNKQVIKHHPNQNYNINLNFRPLRTQNKGGNIRFISSNNYPNRNNI